jgi:hypothetical protein
VKLELALTKMVEAGLQVGDVQEALAILKRLDIATESASQTLLEFLEIVNGERKYFDIGHAEVYGPLPPDFPVYALDEALDVLSELSSGHQLALVSMGKPEQQLLKLKNAGIDSTIFSKILISEDRTKSLIIRQFLKSLDLLPLRPLCVETELKEIVTRKRVGMHHGPYAMGKRPELPAVGPAAFIARDVDYAIKKLSQIKDILTTI